MVVTYYIKLFHAGADRHNGILMSLLLLVAETIKNIYLLLSKAHPISVISVVLHMNNFAELQCLSMMEFSFNTFPLNFDSLSTKVCVRFHR